MATTVETIKERLSIVDVLGPYLKLEKSGINFKARCPFHNEKTASFFISANRNTFYCFGCGAKGDIFEFVERFEGLDFKGALRLLADRAGVPLVYEKTEDKNEKDKLYEVLELATSYFEEELEKNQDVQSYLLGRGLNKETIKSFRLGYSLPSWRALSMYLEGKGFSKSLIEKAGLSKEGQHGQYDRFRGRIMFPIFDSSGRVVAYSGRIFDSSLEGEGATPAKYVNSPETLLYQKSKILYGFDRAKEAIRKWTFTIVVEGQMDLLMSHLAGYNNTVAVSGTALTEDQLKVIKRLSDRLLLSLDSDAAGISASGKSAALALRLGFDVKVANLKSGKDPAEIIKEDVSLWKEIVKNAKHIIEFYLDVLAEKNSDIRKYRLAVKTTVLPYVSMIESAVDQAHFIEVISRRLELPRTSIEDEIKVLQKKEAEGIRFGGGVKKEEFSKQPEDFLLSRKETILRHIIGLIEANKNNKDFNAQEIIDQLNSKLPQNYFDNLFQNESLRSEAAFQVEEILTNRPISKICEELLLDFSGEIIKEELSEIQRQIGEFERKKDDSRVSQLMRDYQNLVKKSASIQEKIRENDGEVKV